MATLVFFYFLSHSNRTGTHPRPHSWQIQSRDENPHLPRAPDTTPRFITRQRLVHPTRRATWAAHHNPEASPHGAGKGAEGPRPTSLPDRTLVTGTKLKNRK